MIISAFAASGKTKLKKENNLSVIDLESSDYQWKFLDNNLSVEERKGTENKIKNKNFIEDYVSAIIEANKEYEFVLIASQPEVLDELSNRNIDYKMVSPIKEMKNTFIKRYKNRGNNQSFIDLMDKNFDIFIDSMINRNKMYPNIELIFLSEEKPYLTDIIKDIKKLN